MTDLTQQQIEHLERYAITKAEGVGVMLAPTSAVLSLIAERERLREALNDIISCSPCAGCVDIAINALGEVSDDK